MKNKLSVMVLCGGQSTEHEISILSANNVIAALDQKKYNIGVVYITHQGAWYLIQDISRYLQQGPQKLVQEGDAELVLCHLGASSPCLVAFADTQKSYPVDCILPILHGTHGEDGCLQGLLQLMNVAYVGADVLSSAMCMDKVITKQLLQANGIATAPWRLFLADEINEETYMKLAEQWGPELFVKPVSLGSSVGITCAKNKNEFAKAVQEVLRYDRFILVEKSIKGREIECAVLGNYEPVASLPSEIISHHGFYSYEAKYLDPQGATTKVPADLPPLIVERVRQIATEAFRVMRCKGMLRVDFFVNDDVILVNEVNTIPGFTNISMYPKMWQVSGISYAELIDQLIELAMQDHQQQSQLERTYINLDMSSKNVESRVSQEQPNRRA